MKCKICNGLEVIKILEKNFVKFKCKNGHTWKENYIDQGGTHKRPENYDQKLEDILYPSEKIIYKTILEEIDKNPDFYKNADAEEKAKAIIQNCQIDERSLYNLLKKITGFN